MIIKSQKKEMAKTLNFDRRPTFTLSQEDEAALMLAARQQGYSKSKLIRELIRGNMSMQKSTEAA